MNDMSNPEQYVDETSRIITAAREALTDQMIERLATTGGTALELVDRLNDAQTNAAVHHLVDRLTEMNKVGALDTVCDMVMLLHAMRSALTDNIVERLTIYAENMVTSVANEDVCNLVSNACDALSETAAETAKTEMRGGLMRTIGLLSKPETQRSLHFLINFADKLQQRSSANGCKSC